MGRTSKFTFPYPGRKRESKANVGPNGPNGFNTGPNLTGLNMSKAQRILGTGGDLNIDFPVRDDASYSSYRPSSRGMSIALSESTHDGEESYTSRQSERHTERRGDRRVERQRDDWDAESGVLPRTVRGKASSTVLGHRFHDNGAAPPDSSSMGRRLREEASSSTLRSHYDRQKSPLSISQQTSASSIRDQALRKGFPPISAMPRSPLLQEEHLDSHLAIAEQHRAFEQASKKKPTRLDLSRLFSRRDSETIPSTAFTKPPSVISPVSSRIRVSEMDGRRKLVKVDSRGKVPQASIQPPSRNDTDLSRSSSIVAQNIHNRQQKNAYQNSASVTRNAHDRRPINSYQEATPTYASKHTSRPDPAHTSELHRPSEGHRGPFATDEQLSWESVQAVIPPPPSAPWDNRSFTSNSSRNTKESRRTSASVFSNSDLRNNSVLSLSSEEGSGEENTTSPVQNGPSHFESPAPSREQQRSTKRAAPPPKINVSVTRQSRVQDENFLTIPLPSPAGSRISGPWNPKRRESAGAEPQDPRDPRRESVSSIASTATGRSSRVMTVTRQEEALLEAMRQKRARMKDEVRKMVIAEQEENGNTTSNKHARKSSSTSSRHGLKQRDSKSSIATLKAATYNMSNQLPNHSKHRVRDNSNSSQQTVTGSGNISATRQNLTARPTTRVNAIVNNSKEGKRNSQASAETVTTSGTINLYLDRQLPLALPLNGQHSRLVETAEPSPDLSDFLSFGSDDDEDETPRTSWIVREQDRGMLRESLASLGDNITKLTMDEGDMPLSPKSRVRLSAVGLKREDSNGSRLNGVRGMTKGVTFVEERVRTPNGCDFLDIGDDDAVWGM